MTKKFFFALFLAASPAWAEAQAPHDDPIAALALWLAIILVTAKLGDLKYPL